VAACWLFCAIALVPAATPLGAQEIVERFPQPEPHRAIDVPAPKLEQADEVVLVGGALGLVTMSNNAPLVGLASGAALGALGGVVVGGFLCMGEMAWGGGECSPSIGGSAALGALAGGLVGLVVGLAVEEASEETGSVRDR
jgi:hypothetical protein